MYVAGDDDGRGSSGSTGTHLHVTPDNVLAVRNAIRNAVDEADRALRREMAKFNVDACAYDPVSREAKPAWNYRLIEGPDSHANRINEYILRLHALVEKLTATAQTYGLVEQANAETLRGTGA